MCVFLQDRLIITKRYEKADNEEQRYRRFNSFLVRRDNKPGRNRKSRTMEKCIGREPAGFCRFAKAWKGIEHLRNMKKYNAENALQKVHSKIAVQENPLFWVIFRKVAAILILPLLAVTFWFALRTPDFQTTEIAWNTLETPAGMRSEFVLPDGTQVYLNSKTILRYPMTFSNDIREVKLDGEAYFQVAEDKKHPFVVNTGKVNIEVTGTEFKASNYRHENLTEIVLISGSIQLFKGDYSIKKSNLTPLRPENGLALIR